MKLVVIGCGGMGTYQAKKFLQQGSDIVGAIDHNPSTLKEFCSLFNVPWSSSRMEDLLEMQGKADAVSCALPDRFHLPCCSLVLRLGFALFAEKPLGLDLAQTLAIVDASERSSLPAMINYSKRNMPALHALKTLLDQDGLSPIQSVSIRYAQGWVRTNAWGDWRTTSRWKWRLMPSMSNGGCIGDLASHLVDALFFLFGNVFFSHSLHGTTLQQFVLDQGISLDPLLALEFFSQGSVLVEYSGLLEVGGDIPCLLSCTQISPDSDDLFSIIVTGSEGEATLDSSLSRSTVQVSYSDGSDIAIEGPSVASTYGLFARWVDSGIASSPTLYDGLRVQKILEEMKQWRSN